MNLKISLTILFISIAFGLSSQAFKLGENLANNPKHKDAVNDALTSMQNCMKVWYFKDKKTYDNTLSPILDKDGKSYSDFVQMKLGDNSLLVVLIGKTTTVVDKKENLSTIVTCCSYLVKYGEIDKSTIKYCWLDKKRVYPKNNEFTEELWITNNMYFKITDHQYLRTLTIKDYKEIDLINMGANFCN